MIGTLIPTKSADLSTYCPIKWENLEPTADDKVKFCSVCTKKVFFCETLSEIEACQKNGNCIAFETYQVICSPPLFRPVKMWQVYGGAGSTAAVAHFKQCQKSKPD